MSDRGAPQEGIKVGLAEWVITPDLGGTMRGFAARKGVSQGIHDDLYVRAMAIEGPETAAAFLSVSVCSLDQEIIDGTREEVQRRTGLPAKHIMMAATHTHSGPKPTEAYNAFLTKRCVECLMEAWECRVEARLGIGIAQVEDVGRNRRRLEYGGLPVDPDVGIVKVEDLSGKVLGVLFQYSCHATVMGPRNLLISEDWPYYAIRTIREQVGDEAVVIFANGAEGDINPGYSSGLSCIGAAIPIRTWAFAEKIGVRMGKKVSEALSDVEMKSAFPIRSVSEHVDLPLRRTFPVTVAEAEEKRKAAQEALEQVKEKADVSQVVIDWAEVDAFFAGMVCNLSEKFYSEQRESSVRVEIQALRLGDAVLVTFPGEVFIEIALEVKCRSPFQKTLVVGLANAGKTGGYMPTRAAFSEGDYEVFASNYSEEAGEVLIEAALEQIAKVR